MKSIIFLTFVSVASCAISAPKKYDPNGSFLPTSLHYREPPKNTTSDNEKVSSDRLEFKTSDEDPTRLQRFGITSYGNSGLPLYPQSGAGVGPVAPLKIDLGGIVLGTLIGLGAVLIIPKLSYIFSGGYKRSIENEMESVTDVLSRIDRALEEHHIDSSTCMQRIVCSYVQEAQKNALNGDLNTFDKLINTFVSNSMVSFLMDGTSIQQAIKIGKQNDPNSCSSLYSKCPVSNENIIQVISSLLPS